MFGFRSLSPDGRFRRKAARVLFIMHGAERTPEGRSLLLLRQWLSPVQHEQFLRRGYFEVVGNETGKRYRIYPGTSGNVCELDKKGRPREGLCFTPVGTLPIGDVMIADHFYDEHSGNTYLMRNCFIAQDVEPITHADTPEDLVRKGRNIEQRVLSRAVLYYLQDRILINANKTVVFRD